MQTIIVDMTPGFRMPTIYYSQGDIGTQFAVDLRSRFGDSLPAGATVTIQATKPSGFGFSEAATSVTNGVAVFTTVAGMTDEAGRFAAELKVEASGITLFTANFYMNGEASTHPEGTIDGSEETVIPELTQLVERVETAASSVLDMTVEAETLAAGSQATYSYDEDTNTATFGIPQGEAGAGAAGVTASAYSSSGTYAVGDYVIHNSNLYRCTTAITTAEAFTAAHWTQVVLADDVTDLKSEIIDITDNEIISYDEGYTRLTATPIDLTNAGKLANVSQATALVSCTEGDVFTINGKGGNTAKVWSFTDNEGNVLSAQSGTSVVSFADETITAPSGASYLVLNSWASENHLSYKGLLLKDRVKSLESDTQTINGSTASALAQLNSVNGTVYNADKSDDNPTQTYTGKLIGLYGLIDIPSVPSYVVKEYSILNSGIYYIDAFSNYDNCLYQALDAQGNILFTKTKASSGATIEEYKAYILIPSGWKTIRVAQAGTHTAYFGAGLLEYTTPTILKWSGLKWSAMGDSLTEENDRTSKHYFDYISDATGISVVNLGKSGTGYKRRDAQNEAFYQRVDTIPTDSDVVTIFGSGNDCSSALTFGTYTDTTTDTVAGCVNTTISDIISRFLNADKLPIIGIIAPTPWMGNMPEDGSGQIMETYVNLLKQICEYRCIPFLDLYHDSCMFPNIAKYRTLAYSNDGGAGTHPDEAGHKVFAPRVQAFLDTLLLH